MNKKTCVRVFLLLILILVLGSLLYIFCCKTAKPDTNVDNIEEINEDTLREKSISEYKLGLYYYSQGDLREAREHFDTAVKLFPDNVDAAAGLEAIDRMYSIEKYKDGLRSYYEGDYEKAKENFQAALELNPENVEALEGLKKIEDMEK